MELNDLIKTYDDVLSKEDCENLIRVFEDAKEKTDVRNTNMTFTEYFIPTDIPFMGDIRSKIINYQNDYVFSMQETLNCNVFPLQYSLEKIKVKRYISKLKEEFKAHVDSIDINSCFRYLSSLVYLNDNFEGGQTTFNDLTIEPKLGRLLIFPPQWMFPHAGTVPINNDKYVLTTYRRFYTVHPNKGK